MIRHNGVEIDRKRLIIYVDGAHYEFQSQRKQGGGFPGKIRFRVMQHLLLARNASIHELFDAVYGDDPEGGPDGGHHVLWICLNQMKPVFARLGLKLRKHKHNSFNRYSLVRHVV